MTLDESIQRMRLQVIRRASEIGASAACRQITACDAASSYGVARILRELSAAAVAQFLRDVLQPAVTRAGWSLRRVLTDGGPEFKAEFAAACAPPGHSPHADQAAPRWTNGFVERLQRPSIRAIVSAAARRRPSSTAPWRPGSSMRSSGRRKCQHQPDPGPSSTFRSITRRWGVAVPLRIAIAQNRARDSARRP